MIIGISGYARAGKDTVADILVNNHGFTKVSWADKLREVLYELNPMVGDGPFGLDYVQNIIHDYGWDGYKDTEYGPEIRRLLQRLGTEAGRQVLGENIWVDTLMNNLPEGNVVIPDTRYPNEARAVKEHDGVVWRVNRAGTNPVNAHISETGLDHWNFDWQFDNDGTIEQLENQVNRVYNHVFNLNFNPVIGQV